jgi:hypothetical protein
MNVGLCVIIRCTGYAEQFNIQIIDSFLFMGLLINYFFYVVLVKIKCIYFKFNSDLLALKTNSKRRSRGGLRYYDYTNCVMLFLVKFYY